MAARTQQIAQFILIFALVYLLTQTAFRFLFPDQYGPDKDVSGVMVRMVDATVKGQHHGEVNIRNKTDQTIVLADRCPMPPFVVTQQLNGEPYTLETEETALPCQPLTEIPAGETVKYSLGPWKYSLFSEYGSYDLELPLEAAPEGSDLKTSFRYYEVGMFTELFRTFISKPLLNLLIFIASLLPGYNLGMAIILLTIIVKLVLFAPTQHAMEGQRKMQAIQPQMDKLKTKFKDDPQRLQQETMKLWKENKVNPMQSCLPMLIQFPVLIGLFFVIRDGSVLELSEHLLYEMHQNLSWSFGTNFLGFDLTMPSKYVFPPLLAVMQFFQMKLSFAIAKKKKGDEKKKPEAASQQEMQQKMMTYGLPLMIGFFALQFPAAVSLYWGISTVFAIVQQLYVNRKDLS